MVKRALKKGGSIAVATVLLYGAFSLGATAQSLICPIPQKSNGLGVLKESPAQIAETGRFLASGDTANRVSEVAFNLRKRYPGAANAEIENYLVTAYCPAIAKLDGLSVAERQARVDQFAHQASLAIYGH